LIGVRRIVTRDRIVAKAGYDISRVLLLIDEYYGRAPSTMSPGSER
jgi:hypothetical protein